MQTIILKSATNLLSLESQSSNGEISEFDTKNGRIVGVYGFMDPNDDVRGFGFILVK